MSGLSPLALTWLSRACTPMLTVPTAVISACFALPGISCNEHFYLTCLFQSLFYPFSALYLTFIPVVGNCRVTRNTIDLEIITGRLLWADYYEYIRALSAITILRTRCMRGTAESRRCFCATITRWRSARTAITW